MFCALVRSTVLSEQLDPEDRRGLSYSYSVGLALDGTAWIHQFRREGQATQERAEAVIAFCNEQGFTLVSAEGTMLRGWALVEQG